MKKEGEEVKEEKDSAQAVMQCNPANLAAFNARLRADLPGAYGLAKALHHLGMIDGLRGARIGPVGSLGGGGVQVELSNAAEARLKAKEACR